MTVMCLSFHEQLCVMTHAWSGDSSEKL